ncbi:MAG: MFS transporter [Chloroflexi bacterium]|nr:MFS transporter [Chloroflexota bacterium]
MNSTGTSQGADPDAKVTKGVVLFVASMAAFLTPFMGSSVNIAIPSIATEFRVDAVTLSWIATAYLLTAAMFLIPWGRVADIYGRRRIFLSGVIGYTVVSFLCGLSVSETMLIGLRALQGFTDAMMFGTGTAIVTSVYPPRERGRALGITVTGTYIGLSLGPFIGGLITSYLGWRSIFFLTTAMGLSVVVLTLWKMRGEWVGAKGEKMDLVGSGIFGFSLLVVMYGFSVLPGPLGYVLILVGVVSLVVFVLWERRVIHPVLDISLFRHNIVFALSNMAALINYAATFALAFMLSLYLQYIKALDADTAGIVLLSQPIMMAGFSSLAGRLSDRIEPRLVASTGMFLTTVGLALIALLSASSSLLYIVAALLVTGLGFALFSSPNTNAIMGCVDKSCYGVASATVGEMRLVGQMLSMGIATLVLAVFLGNVPIEPQTYPAFLSAFRFSFIVFAVLCFIGIFASLARGNIHRKEAPGPPFGM